MIFFKKREDLQCFCCNSLAKMLRQSDLDRGGIYAIRVRSDEYIGSSVCMLSRREDHKRHLRSGEHHCVKLQEVWDRFGVEHFRFTVLEFVNHAEMLAEREQYWIDRRLPSLNGTWRVARSVTTPCWIARETKDWFTRKLRVIERAKRIGASLQAAS